MMTRVRRFLGKALAVLLVLLAAGSVLFALQFFFGLFDAQIAAAARVISGADSKLSGDIFAGISFGTVLLVGFVILFPLFMKGVHHRQYFTGLRRGVVSAFVFYLSEILYRRLAAVNRYYMLLAMILVIIATFILIEVISLSAKEEEEVSYRTDLLSAVVAGLLFGVILKLFVIGEKFIRTRQF